MARISTHVLDTALGKPAGGIPVELKLLGELQGSATTNTDGRTDAPLLAADRLVTGWYKLIFHTGNPFYGDITIRFNVTEPEGNYHIPLLLSPYGYSTYRGS